MRSFDELFAMAVAHKGSAEAVEERLPSPKSAAELAATPDDRYLAEMAKAIFSAGFVWKVVENKWPGFEEAFDGFDPPRVAFYSDDDIARLMSDTRIIRNGPKVRAVHENAVFLVDLAREHGSAARFFADWPASDFVGLWQVLKKRGSRLGGSSAQFALRFVGWDSPVLMGDVLKALIREGVVDKAPTSKAALKAVQDAFNTWAGESGRPMSQISRLLALSVG